MSENQSTSGQPNTQPGAQPNTPPNTQPNLQPNTQPNTQPAPYFGDERDQWRAQRRARRDERRAARHANGPWIGGAVLILLGVIFLLQNIGLATLNNWWALFILIPALGSFSTAYALYRNSGDRLTYAARGSLIGGLVFTLLAFAFLFELSFGVFAPVLLIVAGIGLLLNFLLPS